MGYFLFKEKDSDEGIGRTKQFMHLKALLPPFFFGLEAWEGIFVFFLESIFSVISSSYL